MQWLYFFYLWEPFILALFPTRMKISIHRALAELKLIDARIEKQTLELIPTGVNQKGKLINGRIREEDFAQSAQAHLQSIHDLLARKQRLKSAIVEANSRTRVQVGPREMTIADAINFKVIVKQQRQLLDILKTRHAAAITDMEKKNALVEQNLQKVLEATFGKDNVKISKEDLDAVRKPFLEANEWHVYDPLKVEKIIEQLDKEVSEFEAEVDAVLSEINAITLIEV